MSALLYYPTVPGRPILAWSKPPSTPLRPTAETLQRKLGEPLLWFPRMVKQWLESGSWWDDSWSSNVKQGFKQTLKRFIWSVPCGICGLELCYFGTSLIKELGFICTRVTLLTTIMTTLVNDMIHHAMIQDEIWSIIYKLCSIHRPISMIQNSSSVISRGRSLSFARRLLPLWPLCLCSPRTLETGPSEWSELLGGSKREKKQKVFWINDK